MLRNFRIALIVLVLLVAFPVVVSAQETATDPVLDITKDLEALPGLLGLGSVVSVVVMLMHRFGLKDGWGGYANLIVGCLVFVAALVLPAENVEKLFEVLRWLGGLLIVLLGGQVTHAGAKYAKLDKLWKKSD
jgi:peptidoglycan/LPS O-acetylase OafA/YrhL